MMKICMFCDKNIESDEDSVYSHYSDGTDAHRSCGEKAVIEYFIKHGKDI